VSGGESNAKGQEHEAPKGSGETMGKDRAALFRGGSGADQGQTGGSTADGQFEGGVGRGRAGGRTPQKDQ